MAMIGCEVMFVRRNLSILRNQKKQAEIINLGQDDGMMSTTMNEIVTKSICINKDGKMIRVTEYASIFF